MALYRRADLSMGKRRKALLINKVVRGLPVGRYAVDRAPQDTPKGQLCTCRRGGGGCDEKGLGEVSKADDFLGSRHCKTSPVDLDIP